MKFKTIVTDKYHDYKLEEIDLTTTKSNHYIKIKDIIKEDTYLGMGGAFTEASGYNLSRVSKEVRDKVLKLYFSKDGLNYNMGRVCIGGSDFSLGSYDYLTNEDLNTFSLSRDERYILPLIKDAEEVRGEKISLLASPWSPPAFMKDNNSYIHGGHLKKECYDMYSSYLSMYVNKMRELGFKLDYLTIQNETEAVQRWDSCIYTPEEEVAFSKFLKEKLPDDVKLYCLDHNRDILLTHGRNVMDADLTNIFSGVAIHWYDNEPYDKITKFKELYPNRELIHTESCLEGGPHFGEYEGGERYSRNIIGDLSRGVRCFIDWNLVLDETGGPNWVNNLCSSPIMLKIFHEEIILMPSYYHIGHISKYVEVGSNLLKLDTDLDLPMVGFIKDNMITIIILNNTEEETKINVNNNNIKLLPRSITTIITER